MGRYKIISQTYDEYARNNYDQLTKDSQYTVPAWIRREFPDTLKTRPIICLDLACGSGNLGLDIKDLNPKAQLWGVDLSEGMLKKAREKSIYTELLVHNLDEPIAELRLPKADLIMIFGVLEFLHNAEARLLEFADALKSGGLLLSSFQHYDPNDPDKPRTFTNALGFDHRSYTESEVEEMLVAAGLSIEKIEPVIGYVSPSSGRACGYLLARATKKKG